MEALVLALFAIAVAVIATLLPILSLLFTVKDRARLRGLEQAVEQLQREHAVLRADFRRLRAAGEAVAAAPSAPPAEPARPAEARNEAPLAPEPARHATPTVSAEPAAPVAPAPAVAAQPAALPPPARAASQREQPAAPGPLGSTGTTLERPAVSRAPLAAASAWPGAPVSRHATPPPGSRAAAARSSGGGFDWEGLIGVRLFSAISGIALVIAAIFFLRYSIEQGWLLPPVRVAIGLLTGLSLLVACEWKAARRYRITANALDAAAVSILFATFFAAHIPWGLVPAGPTFLLLALVAAVAVLLSIRHESLFIAVLGLAGGFATPYLLSTGDNRPIPLFAYLLLLNVGLAWVARERGWTLLVGLSLALTTLYQWGWVVEFLDAAQLPLAVSIFLVFPAVGLAFAVLARRRKGREERDTLETTALLGSALPLLFGLYVAAVPAYGARFGILFVFLLLTAVGLVAIGLARRVPLLPFAAGAGTLVALAVWLARSYTSDAWPLVLGVVAAFVLLFAAVEPVAGRLGLPIDPLLSSTTLVAPLLLAAAPALVVLEPGAEQPLPLFTWAFALLALLAAWAVRRGRGAIYYWSAFFVLCAEALWSARFLVSERLGAAFLLYLAFGLAYLLVPLLARRFGRPLEPAWAPGAVLLAALLLLLSLAHGDIAAEALAGLAFLLTLLNAGLFVHAAASRLPALSLAGGFISWLVLWRFWLQAADSVGLLPALAFLTGTALLMIAGHLWTASRGGVRSTASGAALALVAHVFLLSVAVDPERALPPGPLFACLGVLTLALTAAALWQRHGGLHLAGTSAASLVLVAWVAAVQDPGWAVVGLGASLALAAHALAGLRLGHAAGDDGPLWPASAAVALVALAIAGIAASAAGRPPTAALIATQVIAAAALLALATARGWPALGYVALATTTIASTAFGAAAGDAALWNERLLFAGCLYLVFLLWPLLAGRGAARLREPWLCAILASAPFFLLARPALLAGGFRPVIGVLPLAQALAMALLLRRLLTIESARDRDTSRLALVAGTALAFVTVAIPLQLDRQWITIGWALEGAALAWLFRRVPHRGLLWTSATLLGAAFVRLSLNSEVLHYAERSTVPILNWYLYTYVLCAAALICAGALLRREDDALVAGLPRTSTAAFAGAGVLLFLLLNIEIADFYAEGTEFALRFGARLDQDLTYTLGWLVFGLGLLAVGIAARSRGARLTALTLVAVTVCKGFLYDLARLGGLYRVASFVGLAVALALVALALQRFVLTRVSEEA